PDVATEFLHGLESEKLASSLAVRDDPADTKLIVQHINRVSDFLAIHARVIVVDDDVPGMLEGPSRYVAERRSQRIIGGEINSVYDLQRLLAESPIHRRCHRNVRYLPKHVSDLFRDGSARGAYQQ